MSSNNRPSINVEHVNVRFPPGFKAALMEAAIREHTSVSDYIRRKTIEALRRDGIDLPRRDAAA